MITGPAAQLEQGLCSAPVRAQGQPADSWLPETLGQSPGSAWSGPAHLSSRFPGCSLASFYAGTTLIFLQFLEHTPCALSFISRPLSMLCPTPGALLVLLFGQILLAIQASAQMSLHRSLLGTHRPWVFPSHMEQTDSVLLLLSFYCAHTPTPFFKCEKYHLEGMCSVGAVPCLQPELHL